jgi:ADP-ribose pyrophosphatase YjhB (NUDIX family)
MWAIPGGFVELDEDLPDAAARELAEETSVRPAAMDQVGAWGRPGRDPRGRTVTAVYVAVARPRQDRARAGDDAAEAAWHPLTALPPLSFDHATVISPALAHLRHRCEMTHLVFGLLAATFSERKLAAALTALGSGAPREDARRLVEAADLEARDGRSDETLYSAGSEDLTRPLRGRVCIFPMEHEAG